MAPYPWKLVGAPGVFILLYEVFNTWRQIFVDGRQPIPDPDPTWMGYSTAKWDGDALVVTTSGFNGKSWLDANGVPTTDALRVVERFRRRDIGHMDIEITIDDAKAYTRPWVVTQQHVLVPNTELLEYVCNENNRDLQHLPGGGPQ